MDEKLIRRAKEKDESAFEEIIDTYKPVVERFAFQFGINHTHLADIVQETFIKIYRKLDQYHRGKFSTWIYQITLNTTRDFYRKQKREQALIQKSMEQEKENISAGYYFEREEHVLLHESIQQLEPKYKAPLILYYFHDKSYEEIGVILKIKLSAVKTRLHRAKRKLKKIYENEIGEEGIDIERQKIG
ncbi:RNA polymerase sigma factor [Virgibacillus sp. YIM 98842]|uniref:RNA polymerase sigma factor n=1 Tax=Virgibacillus sp. YIM 98842 TaxID=2663533 RepID=UPI0013DD37DA|nr:RNA polymerase sigma factor [Virgibacillus sp. YIM 98842]